jgi:hypothetical protein
MIKPNFDHCMEAKELASLLTKEGIGEYSDKLVDSIEQGSTGTEILMALKWHIERILVLDSISDMSKQKAKRLLRELDKSLREC